jgi:hypothetical protein
MELRHQHKNERDVSGEKERQKDELEVRPQWPGKRTLTSHNAPVDSRAPDLKRIRAALSTLRGGGQALPGSMTAEYSKLLGLDLSDVRIHKGGAAGSAAKSLDATAFTHGTDIAVADHLDLDSAFGRHVLAHELVHVAQNKRSAAPMDLAARLEVGPSGSAIEQEAERGAAALVRGMQFQVSSHGRLPGISRFGNDEAPPTGAAVPVPVPGANPPPVAATPTASVPTPTSQPTQAQPAQTPPPPPPPAAQPTPQPRPTDQPAATATPAAPATPQTGAPGHNTPSGSGAAPNPTTPANREPRPSATPRPQPAPTPAANLDERVQQELENRADPTLKAGYARAVAGVDALRVQALQFSFTPNGIWNTLVETFTARNAFQDHFGQIYSANAYRGGNSWADTAQAWIEGLRGVVHIIGDVASVISAWAGLAALVTGALALILSETVIGGIALGAIAAICAEVALISGAIKLLTDIIDTILGIIQMIILIVRARNSKDPAQRARFAQLLRKEANDFGANVVSIGVQVAVMGVSAGIGAGLSRGANSFISAFRSEFTRVLRPALKPWTIGANIRNMGAVTAGRGVNQNLTGRNLRGQTTSRRVIGVEADAGIVAIQRNVRAANGRMTRAKEIIPFTPNNQMRGARLVLMRRALISNLIVNTGGFKIGLGGGQLQADIKQPRQNGALNTAGTSSSSPTANGGRLDVPRESGADLSKVQMWPSQIGLFENAKGPIQGTVDRTQRQYDMAETQAGPELAAQVRTAFQGANNNAGQMRFGAMQVQTDAQEGQANTQRGLQQTGQARQQSDQMGVQQNRANTSVARVQNEGTRLQSPPPREGVLGWLYNQTIGRIGNWIGSAQRWVTNLVGRWAMSAAGFSKEEMDIAGIENDMREDALKDQNSTQEAQDAATRADQIQQTVFQLQENKTRDEQYAIQAMADAQRFIQALEDADRQLAAAITNGQAYIGQVTPLIAHELQTEEAQAAIDDPYIAPARASATAFMDSLADSNAANEARTAGTTALNQMKAAFPELDISQGNTAISGAVTTYEGAFNNLVGQARGQATALQTALQAFIGTQDYDGVTANAAALETLMADFDRQANALADQLWTAVQSVITQYNRHIQNAIDQANSIPDDPDATDEAAADPGPTPQPQPAPAPTPVQRRALPNAPTISVQRKALTNATAPQQMQQTASAEQPAAVPTDINNPAPAAQAPAANAGDNANAPQPAQATSADAAAGAQVPGAAPNGATSSTPKDGLIGGASNTAEVPGASKAKPANATPKQMSNPGGPDKAAGETEDEAGKSVTEAAAGSGAGSNGADAASEPGASGDKPAVKKPAADQGAETAAEAAPAASSSAAPAAPAAGKKDKKADATPASAPSAPSAAGGGGGAEAAQAPMVSGSTIEDGFANDKQGKKPDAESEGAETELEAKDNDNDSDRATDASSADGGTNSSAPQTAKDSGEAETKEEESAEDGATSDGPESESVAEEDGGATAGATFDAVAAPSSADDNEVDGGTGTGAREDDKAASASEAPEVESEVQETQEDGAVQRRSNGEAAASNPVSVATAATAGGGGSLPYLDTIQSAFGHHDIAGIRSHSGNAAAEGAAALGASAFAVGDAVAFASPPDLHTAAHEAAHVVQQRAGLRPDGGSIDTGSSDSLEKHADAVADAVVAGRSAQSILDSLVGGSSAGATATGGVQRKGTAPTVTSETQSSVEGAAATRTTVGVGEVVKLTSSVAGTWTATTGTASGAENTAFEWTAPGKAGSAVIRVKTKDGEATKEFAVVGPSKVTFKASSTFGPARDDMMGAGVNLEMTVVAQGDQKVSFSGITVREQAGGASNTSGYFASVGKSGKEDLFHYPTGKDSSGKANAPKQTTVRSDNVLSTEDAASLMDDESQPWTRPFSVGSMSWQVPYLYSCGEVTDQSFTIVTQTMSIVDSKVTVTVTKGAASTSRTPKQPVWQPPKKDAAKKAESAEPKPASPKKTEGSGIGKQQASATGSTGYAVGRADQGYAKGVASQDGPLEASRRVDTGVPTAEIKSTVLVPALEGAGDNRKQVGVGEQVIFSSSAKGTWTATAAGPKGKTSVTNARKYTWTAPATASKVTVTFDEAGKSQTIDMDVIAPTGVDFWKRSEEEFATGTQGAGMFTSVKMLPFTVNFSRTSWKEIPGPPSNMKGYFTSTTPPSHVPNKNWLGIDSDNSGPIDHAAYWGIKGTPGWTAGSFDWEIPNHYKVDGESGAGYEFAKVIQSMAVDAAGTTTVTKGISSAVRAVTSGKTKKKGKGKGKGFAVGRGGDKPSVPSKDAGTALNPKVESTLIKFLLAIMDAVNRTYSTNDKRNAEYQKVETDYIPRMEDELTRLVPADTAPGEWVPFVFKNWFKALTNKENNAGTWFANNVNRGSQFLKPATVTSLINKANSLEAANDATRDRQRRAASLDAGKTGQVTKAQVQTMIASLFGIPPTKARLDNIWRALNQAGFEKPAIDAAVQLLQQYINVSTKAAGNNEALAANLDVFVQRAQAAGQHGILTREGIAAATKFSNGLKAQYPARSGEQIAADVQRGLQQKVGEARKLVSDLEYLYKTMEERNWWTVRPAFSWRYEHDLATALCKVELPAVRQAIETNDRKQIEAAMNRRYVNDLKKHPMFKGDARKLGDYLTKQNDAGLAQGEFLADVVSVTPLGPIAKLLVATPIELLKWQTGKQNAGETIVNIAVKAASGPFDKWQKAKGFSILGNALVNGVRGAIENSLVNIGKIAASELTWDQKLTMWDEVLKSAILSGFKDALAGQPKEFLRDMPDNMVKEWLTTLIDGIVLFGFKKPVEDELKRFAEEEIKKYKKLNDAQKE